MALTIEKVFFWSNDKKYLREFDFSNKEVNYLYGEESTGKTALLYIIDYCLASSNCYIPKGVIQEQVSYFGIVISILDNNEKIVICRKSQNYKSNKHFLYKKITSGEVSLILEELNPISHESIKDLLNSICITGSFSTLLGHIKFRDIIKICYLPQFVLINPREYIYETNSTSGIHKSKIKDLFKMMVSDINENGINTEIHLNDLEKKQKETYNIGKLIGKLHKKTLERYRETLLSMNQLKIFDFNIDVVLHNNKINTEEDLGIAYNEIYEHKQKLVQLYDDCFIEVNKILSDKTGIDDTNKNDLSSKISLVHELNESIEKITFIMGQVYQGLMNNEVSQTLQEYRMQYLENKKQETLYYDNINQRKINQLNAEKDINALMTYYLHILGKKNEGRKAIFNFKDMKVHMQNIDDGKILDAQVDGSSFDWILLHIALSLSIREYFIKNTYVKIPFFLLFDSFGSRKIEESLLSKIYFALNKAKERTDGLLQIIVFDNHHLDISNNNVNLVESLTKDNKLIPTEWIRKNET